MQFIEEERLKIPTAILFSKINNTRQTDGKNIINDSLLASRLSILMSIQAQQHISFKEMFIYVSEYQLIILENVIYKYLEVNLYNVLSHLAIPDSPVAPVELPSPEYLKRRSLLQRVKSFFGGR